MLQKKSLTLRAVEETFKGWRFEDGEPLLLGVWQASAALALPSRAGQRLSRLAMAVNVACLPARRALLPTGRFPANISPSSSSLR